MPKLLSTLLLAALLLGAALPASAQTANPPPGPVYIVQSGDTLWSIALRFHVGLTDLMTVNGLSSGDIFIGQALVIPGLEGLSGTLVTRKVSFGETLRSLTRRYLMDSGTLSRLNHLVTPAQLYAGADLVLLEQADRPAWEARQALAPGETLLELAVLQGSDPWVLAAINGLSGPAAALSGDVLYLPWGASADAPGGLPPAILSAVVDPLPMTQGKTVQIALTTSAPAALSGSLAGRPLAFFPLEGTTQVALAGIHAMTEPGLYPLRFDLLLADGSRQSFEQLIMVVSGNYLAEALYVESSTLDPAVTGPENAWLEALVAPLTPVRYWQGLFQLPVDSRDCVRSMYGNRRSYNDGELYSFHSGTDFGVCSEAHPFDIYAPAAGVVVYTGPQVVRGNATLIDHGWGVYSGYWHQDEIFVSAGETVVPGQLIGTIGSTGRVTGAHLHWEIWVAGVQVDPLQWLDESFPH